jgi:hypothetical protein
MIGIEAPTSENEAYGIVVPVFEKLGYGCFSAADEKKDILKQAKVVILDMVEEILNDGKRIENLGEDYEDYQELYPEFKEWIAIDVAVESLKAKKERINISLSAPLISRIDNFVQTHTEYKDRSDFLALAADREMMIIKAPVVIGKTQHS